MSTPAWSEIEALFHEALPRAPAERTVFLAHRCAGRPDLQVQVEAMLGAHDKASSALEMSPIPARPPLKSGMRLGSYEIVGELGVGGMGEVFRARDPRLERDVAIKILPEAFAHDPERVSRFRREAKMLAALNHPNIGSIYGLEEVASTGSEETERTCLVLELVEGSTLADRIARGPIPVSEALPIARQIAEALEAAHEQGIIHRDLKPANIKLRPDGAVKVLDFGLAKALEPAGAMADASQSPPITSPAMATGTLAAGNFGRSYDIAPDGQRFLMIKAGAGTDRTAAPPSLIVVQHWDQELKRLVPTN